jgi:hypothetical protein
MRNILDYLFHFCNKKRKKILFLTKKKGELKFFIFIIHMLSFDNFQASNILSK